MYGKIFDSMYKGTLYGQWEAIVTFQQFIVLSDADGIVDMTPPAIASITSIPLEIIQKGIEVLSKPDPYSRTQGSEGRRIELIDAHRPWGWVIVNHSKYQRLQDSDTVREQTRERVRRHRELKRSVTDGNGQKRHTDTYTNTDTKNKASSLPPDGGSSIWDFGKLLLMEQGLSRRNAGSIIGMWLKEWDEPTVADAIRSSAGKADAKSYVIAILEKKQRKEGHAKAVKVDV